MGEQEMKVQSLRAKARELALEAGAIEEKVKREVAAPQMRACVGRCFKYRNSYGGSDGGWWLYTKIIGFDEKAFAFDTVQFQLTTARRIEIEYRRHFNYEQRNYFTEHNRTYLPISKSEYNAARRRLLKFVSKGLGL